MSHAEYFTDHSFLAEGQMHWITFVFTAAKTKWCHMEDQNQIAALALVAFNCTVAFQPNA